MVQKWITEFRCGCTNTETIPSPDRPNEINTSGMINKIHDIILNDPKVKVREIVSISSERVASILHMHLCMRKICARWLPWLLTIDQKRIRVRPVRRKIWIILTAIWKIFCVDLWRSMKHRSSTIPWNHVKG